MRDNQWLDYQTRMISLDCTIVALDFPQTTMAAAIHLIEVTQSGLLVPVAPSVNFNFLDDAGGGEEPSEGNSTMPPPGEDEDKKDSGKCPSVTKHPDFFLPIYLGILPAVVYTLYLHIVTVFDNWRDYLHHPFTYSELAWLVTVMLSIGFRWRSIYYDHCNFEKIPQFLYPNDTNVTAVVFEFIPVAMEWFESRRVLGLALFLHLFNFLKFVIQIPALSSLIRTLKIAFNELASFSLSFLVMFMAFVSMFYIIFSVEDEGFQNIPRCISTLWLGMLGELEITPGLWRVKDWTIPMVILFTFISVFVLLTVIVAIISDAHERSRVEREKEEEKRQSIAKKALAVWRRPFRKKGRGSQDSNDKPDGGNHILQVLSSSGRATSSDKSPGFAGIVGMAMSAKRNTPVDQESRRNSLTPASEETTPSLEERSSKANLVVPEISHQEDADTDDKPKPMPGLSGRFANAAARMRTARLSEKSSDGQVPLSITSPLRERSEEDVAKASGSTHAENRPATPDSDEPSII